MTPATPGDLEEVVASAVSRLPPRDRPQLELQLGLEGFRAHHPAGGIIREASSDGAEEGALVVLVGLRGTLIGRGLGGNHRNAAWRAGRGPDKGTARATVMSLWEVAGVTTQKTMEAYDLELAEGMGPGEAMQAVQLEMLRTTEHADPKDWAAFIIVSGDDTPMVFPEGEEPRVEEPQGPPPVRRPVGCAVAAPSPDRDPSVPALLLGLLALGVLRRRGE